MNPVTIDASACTDCCGGHITISANVDFKLSVTIESDGSYSISFTSCCDAGVCEPSWGPCTPAYSGLSVVVSGTPGSSTVSSFSSTGRETITGPSEGDSFPVTVTFDDSEMGGSDNYSATIDFD